MTLRGTDAHAFSCGVWDSLQSGPQSRCPGFRERDRQQVEGEGRENDSKKSQVLDYVGSNVISGPCVEGWRDGERESTINKSISYATMAGNVGTDSNVCACLSVCSVLRASLGSVGSSWSGR